MVDGSTEHSMYCRPEHFCLDDSIRWEYKPSITSLTNWMTQYHLECSSSAYVASFMQAYLTGLVIGSFISPLLISKFGQKRLVILRTFTLAVFDIFLLLLPKKEDLLWS